RLAVPDERAGKAHEQVRIFRLLPVVLVLGVTVGVVDADADDLFATRQRRQKRDGVERVIGLAGRSLARLADRIRTKQVHQGRIFLQLATEIDHAAVGHRPIAGAATHLKSCKTHGIHSLTAGTRDGAMLKTKANTKASADTVIAP